MEAKKKMPDSSKDGIPTLSAIKTPCFRTFDAECPICEGLHPHVEGKPNTIYYGCEPAAGSPFAVSGYRLTARMAQRLGASPMLADVPLPEAKFWRHARDAGTPLRSAVAALILQRRRPASEFDGKLKNGRHLLLHGSAWHYDDRRGTDLASLAAALYRTTAGIAAVRIAATAMGLQLDPEGFLAVEAAFAAFFARTAARRALGGTA